MKSLYPVLSCALALLLAAPAFAQEDPPPADEEAETPAPEETPVPEPAEAAPAPEAPEAPTVEEPWLPSPGEAAVEAVGVALDRIAALELLLADSEALDGDGIRAELDAARVALRLALVELGRLRQDEDLRTWLMAQGLVAEEPATVAAVGADDAVEPGLSPEQLRTIVREVEAISFTEGKMAVVTNQLDSETLTSEQASSLLELFGFSRDRVDLLVFFHPRITDPENFDGLLSALKFESDREAVRNQVGALR